MTVELRKVLLVLEVYSCTQATVLIWFRAFNVCITLSIVYLIFSLVILSPTTFNSWWAQGVDFQPYWFRIPLFAIICRVVGTHIFSSMFILQPDKEQFQSYFDQNMITKSCGISDSINKYLKLVQEYWRFAVF